MEAAALVILGAVLFAHAWHLLRYTDLRASGVIAGVGAVMLGLLVFWDPLPKAATIADPSATAMLVLLGALYAAGLATVALWGLDSRPLGFYSLFAAVGLVLLTGHFVGVDERAGVSRSSVLALAALVQVVLFGLLFFHLVPPFRKIQPIVGWFFLVGAVLIGLIGVGIPLGFFPPEAIAR
jgi:hypothetical protein